MNCISVIGKGKWWNLNMCHRCRALFRYLCTLREKSERSKNFCYRNWLTGNSCSVFFLARSRHVVSLMIPALQRYLVNSKSGLAAAIRWSCMWCISLICFIRAIQLSLTVFWWKIFSQKWHLLILSDATTLLFLTKWVILCLIQDSSSSSLNFCWQPIIVLKGHFSSWDPDSRGIAVRAPPWISSDTSSRCDRISSLSPILETMNSMRPNFYFERGFEAELAKVLAMTTI